MIGVFDSGFGGLTVLKSFLKYCPEYNYIYLGDNARVPYGGKSRELIYEYSKQALDFLFKNDCQLVIFACNTASALALRKIQQEYLPEKYPDKKVLGVVRPIAENVASNKELERVGVIGTKATINSKVYSREINNLNKDIKVFEQSSPLLVPIIEDSNIPEEALDIILKQYLQFVTDEKIEELILACTHYPLLIDKIKNKLPKNCKLDCPGDTVAKSLLDYLDRHEEIKLRKEAKQKFYTTDSVEKFRDLGEIFLGREMKNVKKVNL